MLGVLDCMRCPVMALSAVAALKTNAAKRSEGRSLTYRGLAQLPPLSRLLAKCESVVSLIRCMNADADPSWAGREGCRARSGNDEDPPP